MVYNLHTIIHMSTTCMLKISKTSLKPHKPRISKSVFSFLRQLSTRHCPHLLLSTSNRSISPGRQVLCSKPTTCCCYDQSMKQTDKLTLNRFIDHALHTVRAVSKQSKKYLELKCGTEDSQLPGKPLKYRLLLSSGLQCACEWNTHVPQLNSVSLTFIFTSQTFSFIKNGKVFKIRPESAARTHYFCIAAVNWYWRWRLKQHIFCQQHT